MHPASPGSTHTQKRKSNRVLKVFNHFAKLASTFTGHPAAFGLAVIVVALWGLTGPLFGYSDTWQLVINTSTTIVTFLMVFLIQNTQNRDMAATHIKLDEVIRALQGAHNALLDLEELDEKELEQIRGRYEQLAKVSRKALREGKFDTGCEELEQAPADEDEPSPITQSPPDAASATPAPSEHS
ncbi:low affinity iron permease family protein [Planctomicrobium piriforme]|uniref:Low affinity Fe/Cu permease n=1 Tax=Planctomicrobium piriforme TaxID=1576369 RepID=A0A1I3JTW4_9PLAN|nr:low affinity iron permease family protein [Planctomicrobium piriforme]SFI63701.1 Low affinity Fe/Cu permease [Planctomicrobium piriforme]